MDTKNKRIYRFLWFAILNLALILWVLTPLTPITSYLFVVLCLISGLDDFLVIAWSLRHIESKGLTSELGVVSTWVVGQIFQLVGLTIFIFLNFGVIGFLALLLLMGWMRWRISTLNGIMDVRFWHGD